MLILLLALIAAPAQADAADGGTGGPPRRSAAKDQPGTPDAGQDDETLKRELQEALGKDAAAAADPGQRTGATPAPASATGGAAPNAPPLRGTQTLNPDISAILDAEGGYQRRPLQFLNGDDPVLRAADLPGAGTRTWFSASEPGPLDWEHARLRGQHNLENAVAAATAARAAGAGDAAVKAALRHFDPPPHRLQPVAATRGVEWVNDSKATNPDATVKALTAFDHGVHLILGGSLKGASFSGMAAAVAAGPVARSYLIGASAEAIAAALDAAGAGYVQCGTLERAVAEASAAAVAGDTILLSPACASFDQFRDYEQRGERFAELARAAAE